MKVYFYSRISTNRQKLTQQRHKVTDYIARRGWSIEKEIFDEDVSGYKVRYDDRGLRTLIDMMSEGDCLICSELSRLCRSMADVNRLVNDDLKPRKLRLVIVSMGIDLDCSRMRAIDELILQNFAFAAQAEAEMLSERTKSALDAIKDEIARTGKHVSNIGRVITRLGAPSGGCTTENAEKYAKRAITIAESKRKRAKSNDNNERFYRFLVAWEARHGEIDRNTDLHEFSEELNRLGYKTATGMDFDIFRARSMANRVKSFYANA